MGIRVLPTRTDIARYSFELELESRTYTFEFDWNDRDASWYVSLHDGAGNFYAAGWRLQLNQPLFVYGSSSLLSGRLIAIDTTTAEVNPGLADLGERVKLLYIPPEDFPGAE